MIKTIRYTLLLMILGLFAAAFFTWEPTTQDSAMPMPFPQSNIETLLTSWAEKVPPLKEELHQLTDDITTVLSEWKENAVEQSSFFSGMSFDQFSAEKTVNDSTQSLMILLTQLKEQFEDVNMEGMQEQIQRLIDKARSLPQSASETDEE